MKDLVWEESLDAKCNVAIASLYIPNFSEGMMTHLADKRAIHRDKKLHPFRPHGLQGISGI